jgi:diguanylate cyclase (GGDEF)-like protein
MSKPSLRIGFRVWLLLASWCAALPLLAFSLFSLYELADSQRNATKRMLAQRSQAAANEIERRLEQKAGMLNAIALTDAALNGDLALLHAYLSRLAPMFTDVLALTLVTKDGSQLINTLRPFGEPMPLSGDSAQAKLVIETGRPTVSGVFDGSVSSTRVTSLGVRVSVRGEPKYCLRMIMRVTEFINLLREQNLPEDWTATIIDANGVIIARSRSPEEFIGVKVLPSVKEALDQGRQGVFSAINQEGVPMQAAIERVAPWGWSVAVHVPTETLHSPLRSMLLQLFLGGMLCLAVGFASSLLLHRRLAGAVDSLSSASAALANGAVKTLKKTYIREIDEMGSSLNAAKARENQALLDHLTKLPGRARLSDLAHEQEEKCLSRAGFSLAVLYIDLDGFKLINDKHGHDQGDAVLVSTAQALLSTIRDTDVAARLGGDEFAVVLSAPTPAIRTVTATIADRILTKINAIGYGLGCSIGIAVCPEQAPDFQTALSIADRAMYEAKQSGKNRVVLLDAPSQTKAETEELYASRPH